MKKIPEKLFEDFVSVVVILLTLTGLYLWAIPKWRKRQNAKKTAERAAAVA